MDLEKLIASPLYVAENDLIGGWIVGPFDKPASAYDTSDGEHWIADFVSRDEAESFALARNALDVMMRRGWGVRLADASPFAGEQDMKWFAIECRPGSVNCVNSMIAADDPFTALVEADSWHRENVESVAKEAEKR